jgi:hypothetical protein
VRDQLHTEFDSLLTEAREALAELGGPSGNSGMEFESYGRLYTAEGRLAGFILALAISAPAIAAELTPRAEGFIGELVAAKILFLQAREPRRRRFWPFSP